MLVVVVVPFCCIVNYEITLQQKGTTTTSGNTYSNSYKRVYQEQNNYLYIQGEQIYYSYYLKEGENQTQNPLYSEPLQTNAALPYVKVKNWSGTPNPNIYYYSQWVFMLEITPYHTNTNNQVIDQFNLLLNTTATEFNQLAVPQNFTTHTITQAEMKYDIITSTADLSHYIGSTTWAKDGYVNNMLEELTTNYTYGNTIHREDTQTWTTGTKTKSIDFNITAGQTNYLFLFITPQITLNTQINYPTAHIALTRPNQDKHTLKIAGTGIIPNTNYEVIDVGGLMFDIVGMPFYFISTAFNLTLFPGTPYQINISSLFLSLIAVLVFIFLLRLLLKVGK